MRVNGPWGYLQIGDTGRLRKAPFRSVGRVNHASLAVSTLHWRGILDIGSDSCLCRSAPVNPGGPQPRTLAPDVSLVDHQLTLLPSESLRLRDVYIWSLVGACSYG